MRKWLASGLLALALVPLAAPAAGNSRDLEARLIMQRFAACAVKRDPALASRFVLLPLNERLPERDFQALTSPSCLRRPGGLVTTLRMRGGLFRGALAEELVRAGMAEGLPPDFSAVPPLAWSDAIAPAEADGNSRRLNAKARQMRETSHQQAIADAYVARLGECVVRTDPAGSRAVLLSPLTAEDELATMKAVAGPIASCVAGGQTVRFNRTTLRAGLAISYYRLAVAARGPQPQGTGF